MHMLDGVEVGEGAGGGGGRQGCKDNSLEIVIEQMTLGGGI